MHQLKTKQNTKSQRQSRIPTKLFEKFSQLTHLEYLPESNISELKTSFNNLETPYSWGAMRPLFERVETLKFQNYAPQAKVKA